MNRLLKAVIFPTSLFCLYSPITHADNSLFLYGAVDSGYGYEQFRYKNQGVSAKASTSGLNEGYLKSSRWGIKGAEDLGNETQAIFHLEQGVALSTGRQKEGYAFSRKAILGLSSTQWGSFTIGRQKTLGKDFIHTNTTEGMGEIKHAFGASGLRTSKLAKYITPAMKGLKAGIGYASNGGEEYDKSTGKYKSTNRDYLVTTGLYYSNGPLSLGGVYDWGHANQKEGGRQGYRVHNWILAASYDFSSITVNLAYGQDKNGKFKSAGYMGSSAFGSYKIPGFGSYNTQGFKSHNYMVSLSAPLGAGKLGLAWTRSSSNLDKVYSDNNPKETLSTQAQTIYAAMYTYPLSKRTTLYGYGSYGTGLAYLDHLTGTEAGIGLSHKF